MEQVISAIIAKLFDYGLPGLFIGFLIWKNWRLEKVVEAKDEYVKIIVKERVTEAITFTNAMSAANATLENVKDALERIERQKS